MKLGIGDATFDPEARELRRAGEPVHLAPKGFHLLTLLLESRPRALSKAELQETLWPDAVVEESNLASLVNDVRSALRDDARQPRFIRTLHGFGYAFVGEVVASPEKGRAASCFLLWGKLVLPLVQGENVIGRDTTADVSVPDSSISRRHASISVDGSGATLADLGSKNGTCRGPDRIGEPVALEDGDEIKLGSVWVTFRASRGDDETKTAG